MACGVAAPPYLDSHAYICMCMCCVACALFIFVVVCRHCCVANWQQAYIVKRAIHICCNVIWGFFFVLCSHSVRCGSDFLSYFFTLHALLRTHVHKYVYENCNKVHLLLLLLPLQLLWRTCSPPLHLLLPCCGKLVINSTQRAAVGLRLSSLTPYVCFAICKL